MHIPFWRLETISFTIYSVFNRSEFEIISKLGKMKWLVRPSASFPYVIFFQAMYMSMFYIH